MTPHSSAVLAAMRELPQPFRLDDCETFYAQPRTGRVSPSIKLIADQLEAEGAITKLAPGLYECRP